MYFVFQLLSLKAFWVTCPKKLTKVIEILLKNVFCNWNTFWKYFIQHWYTVHTERMMLNSPLEVFVYNCW